MEAKYRWLKMFKQVVHIVTAVFWGLKYRVYCDIRTVTVTIVVNNSRISSHSTDSNADNHTPWHVSEGKAQPVAPQSNALTFQSSWESSAHVSYSAYELTRFYPHLITTSRSISACWGKGGGCWYCDVLPSRIHV